LVTLRPGARRAHYTTLINIGAKMDVNFSQSLHKFTLVYFI
jgi:hypothetical protein